MSWLAGLIFAVNVHACLTWWESDQRAQWVMARVAGAACVLQVASVLLGWVLR